MWKTRCARTTAASGVEVAWSTGTSTGQGAVVPLPSANVEFGVVVTDTQNGKTRAYYNPLNRAALPVQDLDAFATCP
jgi:hypothetical protein